jgi:hypothetical protein
MAIKHNFNSSKSDGADATLVKASDWNANHTIDAGTITLAQLVNATATQRLIGRNTGGGGAWEEVTASQMLDWVSNTNGVLLTRSGGTWGAAANIGIDNGDLQLVENASPVAPASGRSKVFGKSNAGRQMPAFIGPTGFAALLQPFLGTKSFQLMAPVAGSSTLQALGVSPSNTGTLTARALSTTNLATGTRRVGLVSAAGAGSVAGTRAAAVALWRGNATNAGGFHIVWRFMISDAALVATANMFVGIQTSGAPTDVAPSTLANSIGVGVDNGDTVLQLYASGAAAQARTSLGANFPANTVSTDLYELSLFAAPNAADVKYELLRVNTGDRATGTISAGANLPASTQLLCPQAWRSNGGTATAVAIDIGGMYLESDT